MIALLSSNDRCLSAHSFTVIFVETEFVHPKLFVTEYVMLNVPAPATDGLNLFPDTPVPLHIPPLTEAFKLIAESDLHIVEGIPINVNVGSGFIVNVAIDD